MKLNYHFKGLTVFVLLLISGPVMANVDPVSDVKSVEARVTVLENRLNEIKALDKEAMTHAEKKALRKEVRKIKKELAAVSGGVYLSIGAILLIALLLILLL